MISLHAIRERARKLKVELIALALAARHPQTPWYAKFVVAGCVAYALTPVDLIPDALPIVGFIDDLIFIPLAIALAVRFIPAPVLADCRARSRELDARLEDALEIIVARHGQNLTCSISAAFASERTS